MEYNTFEIAIFDVDGTILNNSETMDFQLKSVLSTLPMKKIIATGRNLISLKKIITPHFKSIFDRHIICYNGNAIYDHEYDCLTIVKSFDNIEIDILKLIGEKINIAVDIGGKIYVDCKKTALLYSFFNRVDRGSINVGITKELDFRKTLFLHIYADECVLSRYMDKFSDYDINSDLLPSYLIVYPQDTDKVNGLNYLRQNSYLDFSKFIFFGDGVNDVGLMKVSDYGVAVSGSNSELIKYCDILLDCDLVLFLNSIDFNIN